MCRCVERQLYIVVYSDTLLNNIKSLVTRQRVCVDVLSLIFTSLFIDRKSFVLNVERRLYSVHPRPCYVTAYV